MKLNSLNFGKRNTANPWAPLAVLLLVAIGLLSGWRQWDLTALRTEVAQLEDRIEEHRMIQERAMRRARAQSPEEKKVNTLLSAQSAEDRMRPVVLRAIEQSWTPRIAVMNLKLEMAGKAAQLELMSPDLSEVFAFVERLNGADNGMRATVMRHGIKTGDSNLVTLATVRVERR